MNTEQFRADFEAWYRTEFSEDISDSTFIYYESCNRYQRPYIDRMWATYQAGRAALQHSCKETSQDREDALIEAMLEACSEWSQYVEVDSAPRTLREHVQLAIDHARRVEGES